MYLHRNMKNIGLDHAAAPALFSYVTTDTLEAVEASGYFNDPRLNAQAGDTVFVNASNGNDTLVFQSATSATSQPINSTGWATYIDTQYPNSGAAFSVSADTDTNLPNNRGNAIEGQLPIDVTTFYDGTTITGRNGDNLDVMIYFKAVPSGASQYLDIWIDIGGAVGELYRQTFSFPRGAGVERGILYALPSAYTLGTWEANGGTLKVRSNAALDIYAINYNIDRSHKART